MIGLTGYKKTTKQSKSIGLEIYSQHDKIREVVGIERGSFRMCCKQVKQSKDLTSLTNDQQGIASRVKGETFTDNNKQQQQ